MSVGIELIANIATSIIGIHFVTQYCQPRHRGKKKVICMIVGILVYFATVTMLNFFMIFEGVFGFAYLLIIFLYANAFCKGDAIDHAIGAMIWACIILFSTIPIFEFLSLITNHSIDQLLNSNFYLRAEALTAITILKFILCQCMLLKKRKNSLYLSRRDGYVLIGICFLMLLIILGFFTMELHADNKVVRHIVSMLLLFGTILIMLLVFVIFQKLSQYHIDDVTREYTNKLVGKQSEYVKYIEHLNKELQIMRHDSAAHYTTLHLLFNSGKNEEAATYLGELEENIKKYSGLPVVTISDSLNAILYKAYSDCKERDIIFNCIVLAQVSKIRSSDLGILLYNLLNNAIEAASLCDKKEISLEIKNYHCYLQCSITNTVREPVIENNPELITSKKNKELHGFGMESIHRIVEKYDGYYENWDSDGEFNQIIYLKYPTKV